MMEFDQVVGLAKETVLRDGHHSPILLVWGTKGNLPVQIQAELNGETNRQMIMFISGKAVGRTQNLGAIQRVHFISEGWSLRMPEGKTRDDFPASLEHAAGRIEVLQVCEVNLKPDACKLATYEMIRDNAGKLIDIVHYQTVDNTEEGIYVDAPIVRAFLRGYKRAWR